MTDSLHAVVISYFLTSISTAEIEQYDTKRMKKKAQEQISQETG